MDICPNFCIFFRDPSLNSSTFAQILCLLYNSPIMEITLLNTPQTAMITRIHSFALLHRPMLGLELKETKSSGKLYMQRQTLFFQSRNPLVKNCPLSEHQVVAVPCFHCRSCGLCQHQYGALVWRSWYCSK